MAPSFFAAWTFAFWQAFAVKARPLKAAAYATALVAATEVVQLVLPRFLEGAFHRYTADIWDVAAGAAGAGAALLVLFWREVQRRGNSDKLSMRDREPAGAVRRRPPLWYLTTAATLAVGILPIWALESWFDVPRKIIVGYGFLAYIVGVTVIKMPLYHFIVERILRPRLSNPALAGTQGVLSAVSELSAAAAFFVWVILKLSYWQLVGFGVGAGAVEAIMLPFISNPFKGGTLGEHAEEVFRASATDQIVQWLSVLERVWAMLLQVSTRGLVYLSVATRNPIPACVALAGFSVVDGSAYYWHLQKWRFDSLPVLARVHAFLGLIACMLTVAFLWWSEHLSFAAGLTSWHAQ